MIEERNESGYPVLKEVDGSCVRGLYYAFRIVAIVILLFVAGCFLWPKKSHSYETASWYGTTGDTTDPWKHTTTANGEHFNENTLSAASWKYKLGSYVKVTNLRNGKSIVVRLNDRGPGKRLYKRGRIIDLTRAAFLRIAPLTDGVVPVRVVLIQTGGHYAK